MSSYDRFKPTPLKQMAERKEEVQKITNDSDDFQNGDKFKKLNIKKDGTYNIRVYPPHPVPEANSLEAKVIYFVPGERKKRNDRNQVIKNEKGEEVIERYNRPVFDSRVHGQAPYDLIDTYIGLVKKKAESLFPENKDNQKNYLLPISGNRFNGGTLNGLNPMRSFLMYGDLIDIKEGEEVYTFHEFEVHRSIENGMQKIAAIENKQDPLGTDGCFTDPLDGRPVQIIVDSVKGKANSADYYTVAITNEMEKVNVNGKLINAMKQYPISEEQLDWYEKEVPALVEYRKKFTGKDLEIQLKGLILFDEEHRFNVLETEEFKDVYNTLDKLFPKVEEPAKENGSSENGYANSNSGKPQSEDEFDLMDMAELRQYIKDAGLNITVLTRFTEQDVKETIREVEKELAKAQNSTPASTPPAVENNAAAPVETEPEPDKAEPEPEASTPPATAESTPAATGAQGGNWRSRVNNLGAKVTS
jgi:hypothetical protein